MRTAETTNMERRKKWILWMVEKSHFTDLSLTKNKMETLNGRNMTLHRAFFDQKQNRNFEC